MEKGVSLCCLLSRITSVALNNFNYLNITEASSNSIYEKYTRIAEKISANLNNESLSLTNVSVTSNFNGEIKIINGIEILIVNNKYKIEVPNIIYLKLCNFFNKEITKKAPTIMFGFLNRTLNKNGDGFNGSITTGSYSVDFNSICLDILAHEQLEVETLALRIVHELLHDIGFQESDVLSLERKVFNELRVELMKFIDILCGIILESKRYFITNLNKIVNECEAEYFQLVEITKELSIEGFPIPHDSTCNLTVFNPISGNQSEILLF